MPDVIALKNGRMETLFEVRHFEELVDEFMGYDAVRYFRELVSKYDSEIEELKAARSATENYVLRTLLPSISTSDAQREAYAEEFRAKMEDLYGLE